MLTVIYIGNGKVIARKRRAGRDADAGGAVDDSNRRNEDRNGEHIHRSPERGWIPATDGRI